MRRKLTDRFLESIKPPNTGRDTYSDAQRPGLQLRVGQRKASWVFEKRVKGGPKRKHTLGSYCKWGQSGERLGIGLKLSDARALALEIEVEASQGFDRIEESKKLRLEAEQAAAARLSVEEVLDMYHSLKLSTLATGKNRLRELRRALEQYMSKHFTELTKADLQGIIDERIKAGHRVYANRTRAYLRAFTRWAAQRDYLESDVGFSLQGAGREEPRDRVLSLDEIRSIYQATFEVGSLWGPVFRLLILTGQRRGEIAGLRWDNIDLAAARFTLIGTQTKNRRPHITHLSSPALKELQQLAGDQETSGFVFSTTGKTPVSGISQAKKRLDKVLGSDVEHWRLHDLRRAMATALAEDGVPEGVVDRVQNHAASGSAPSAVARVYQQSDLLPQRAVALDRWAEMVTNEVAAVINLDRFNG